MNTSPRRPSRTIAGQLALGFGTVSLVAVGMCLMLLATIQDVSGLVTGMRHQEPSVRQSLDLATSVREQSLHIAHTVIEGDTSDLPHYNEWRERTRLRIQELASTVPAGEVERLQVLGGMTQRMHELFIASVLPAVQSEDMKLAKQVHRELDSLGEQAAKHADALALAVDTRMKHSHIAATVSTRRGLLVGGLCATIVLLLSVGFTLRLRAVVLKPLHHLTESARLFGDGNFDHRAGGGGKGEIEELAQAFDHMAKELANRERRLVRQERMAAIGQLAAGVAHEMNNPIGIIRGYLKTMSPDEDPELLRAELEILDEEAAHCQRISEDLLSYSRSSDLELEELEMQVFLTDSTSRFIDSLVGAPPMVEVNAAHSCVLADRARIKQVLFNLLRNAVDVSEPGVRIEVIGSEEMTGPDERKVYRIDVVDSGPGVPSSERERIFEPFFTKRRGGTGLGLAVVLGIVHGHGGTIQTLESPSGGGLFRVELPFDGPPTSTFPAPNEESW